jgi:hypothetical protein
MLCLLDAFDNVLIQPPTIPATRPSPTDKHPSHRYIPKLEYITLRYVNTSTRVASTKRWRFHRRGSCPLGNRYCSGPFPVQLDTCPHAALCPVLFRNFSGSRSNTGGKNVSNSNVPVLRGTKAGYSHEKYRTFTHVVPAPELVIPVHVRSLPRPVYSHSIVPGGFEVMS